MAVISFQQALKKGNVKAADVKVVPAYNIPKPDINTQQPSQSGQALITTDTLKNAGADYASGLNNQYLDTFNKLQGDVQSGADAMNSGSVPGQIDSFGTVAKKTGKLLETGLNTAGNLISAAFAPITQAVSTGVKSTADVLSNDKGIQKIASNPLTSSALDFFSNANGKLDEWTQKHPQAAEDLQSAITLATTAMGAGDLNKPVTQVAPEALANVKGKLGTVQDGASTALDNVAGTTSDIAGTIKDKASGALDATVAPENIMQRVARISKGKQAAFEKMAGEKVGQYLTKRGIYGNIDKITEQLYNRFTSSRTIADTAFEKLPGTFEPAPVKTALQDLLAREQRISSAGAQSPDLARTSELLNKFDKEGLTMSEINEAKRLYESKVKMDYVRSAHMNPEGVVKATNLDSAIRNWQYKQAETLGLKNLPQINRETRLAKQLLDDLGAEYSGSAGNNAVTLSDWIMLSGGDPTAVGGFLVKKTLSSKSVQSAIAKYLNRNAEVMGPVSADIGPSQVKQLPAGDVTGKPAARINQPINVTGKTVIDAPATESFSTKTNKTGDAYRRNLKTGKMEIIPKAAQPDQIIVKKLIDKYNSIPNKKGGFARIPSRIHSDDLYTLRDFSDMVHGAYTPGQQAVIDLEIAARRIVKKYGITNDSVSNKVLATQIGHLLDAKLNLNDTVTTLRDELGRFSSSKKK